MCLPGSRTARILVKLAYRSQGVVTYCRAHRETDEDLLPPRRGSSNPARTRRLPAAASSASNLQKQLDQRTRERDEAMASDLSRFIPVREKLFAETCIDDLGDIFRMGICLD